MCKKYFIIPGAIALVILVAGLVLYFHSHSHRVQPDYPDFLGNSRTHGTFQFILESFDQHKEDIKFNANNTCELSPIQLNKLFTSWVVESYGEYAVSIKNSCMTDAYGQSLFIWLWSENVSNKLHDRCLLISAGRNKIFEGGLGDDVTWFADRLEGASTWRGAARCEDERWGVVYPQPYSEPDGFSVLLETVKEIEQLERKRKEKERK